MTFQKCIHWFVAAAFLCLAASGVSCQDDGSRGHLLYEFSTAGKPLIKRPEGNKYKTVLSLDGGGVRGMIPAVVLIEVEKSIKQYLFDHPDCGLPLELSISSVDDFDINLVDYFDCMTGVSSGSWSTLYLASRGGHGAATNVLSYPDIVEKYGIIPSGGAEGLRVFYKEYISVIYPEAQIDVNAGVPFDITNPNAPGVAKPLFELEGMERALEAFCGQSTLADLDTSVLIPSLDLISGHAVYFVQNAFKSPPVTSSAVLLARTKPREYPAEGERFYPDFKFDEGKDYYLKDVGAAAAAAPLVNPAKNVTPVGNSSVEFLMIDGIIPVESNTMPAALFVASESGDFDFEKIAVLSIGTGVAAPDLTTTAHAGLAGWMESFSILTLYTLTGARSLSALFDYLYYSNPETLPYQFLRIQTEAPATSEEGRVLNAIYQSALVEAIEQVGLKVAQEYRPSIDVFVRDFVFG